MSESRVGISINRRRLFDHQRAQSSRASCAAQACRLQLDQPYHRAVSEVYVKLRISEHFIRSILTTDTLDAAQVRAIVRTGYLAAEIDLDEDSDERATLDGIGEQLSSVAQLPVESIPLVSPLPLDDEDRRTRIKELAVDLTTRGARELAYVVAYLLAVADVELAPAETRFLADLQTALRIDDDRAADLVATAASAATPGVD
jgi:hypothetical protein